MTRRRMLKTVAVLAALGYCSLLVYHGSVTFNFQESRPGPGTEQVPIETVTKTSAIVNDSDVSNITLDDIFISVKTTRHHQSTRLPIILKTWFQLAKNQTWFFTDIDNEQLQNQTNGHMINTNCSDTHQRKHLCCKTSVEYETYMKSEKRWFCHFDDDNYVNVPRLVTILQRFDPTTDWYLGRLSTNKPISFYNPVNHEIIYAFWFATGGAGYCISRSLALKMVPVARYGRFVSICEQIRYPDDVTMGFIIEHLLKRKMKFLPEFHSHYEQLKLLQSKYFKDQISFGYELGEKENNVLNVHGFDEAYDPTRFLSLHCFLFPDFSFCPR